jgi:hypothetical protein
MELSQNHSQELLKILQQNHNTCFTININHLKNMNDTLTHIRQGNRTVY